MELCVLKGVLVYSVLKTKTICLFSLFRHKKIRNVVPRTTQCTFKVKEYNRQSSAFMGFATLKHPQFLSSLCDVLTIQQLQHSHNRAAPDHRPIHLSPLVSHWCLSLWLRPKGISTQGTFQQQTQPATTASCFSEWTTMSFQQCACVCVAVLYMCVCSETPLASSSRVILWPRPLNDG